MSGIGAKADKVKAFIDFGFMVSGPADSNGAVTNAQQRIRSQSAFAGDAHHGTLGGLRYRKTGAAGTASGRQDHTTSPSADKRLRLWRRLRPSHPLPYVRDDRETPLCVGRDGGRYAGDLGQKGTGIFLQGGLDR